VPSKFLLVFGRAQQKRKTAKVAYILRSHDRWIVSLYTTVWNSDVWKAVHYLRWPYFSL